MNLFLIFSGSIPNSVHGIIQRSLTYPLVTAVRHLALHELFNYLTSLLIGKASGTFSSTFDLNCCCIPSYATASSLGWRPPSLHRRSRHHYFLHFDQPNSEKRDTKSYYSSELAEQALRAICKVRVCFVALVVLGQDQHKIPSFRHLLQSEPRGHFLHISPAKSPKRKFAIATC